MNLPGFKGRLMFPDVTAKSIGFPFLRKVNMLRLRAVLILMRRPAYRWISLLTVSRFARTPIFQKQPHQYQFGLSNFANYDDLVSVP
jgi:hypothetical protein